MAASERRSASARRRCRGASARGRGSVIPKALTKQAAASAADSASRAPTAGISELQRPIAAASGCSRIAWKVSHSETKPLSGGRAEMATQPTRKAKAVWACDG